MKAEIHEKFLGGNTQLFLKYMVEIGAADADVVGDVRHVDAAAVVPFDIVDGLFHVDAASVIIPDIAVFVGLSEDTVVVVHEEGKEQQQISVSFEIVGQGKL